MEERQEDLPRQEETFADENATPAAGGSGGSPSPSEEAEEQFEGDEAGEEGGAS